VAREDRCARIDLATAMPEGSPDPDNLYGASCWDTLSLGTKETKELKRSCRKLMESGSCGSQWSTSATWTKGNASGLP